MKRTYEHPQMETVSFAEWDILTLSVGGGYSKEDSTSLIKGNEGDGDSISFGDLGF